MARIGVLPLRRDAHMHQGKEGRRSTVRRRQIEAQTHQMHAQGLNID